MRIVSRGFGKEAEAVAQVVAARAAGEDAVIACPSLEKCLALVERYPDLTLEATVYPTPSKSRFNVSDVYPPWYWDVFGTGAE